MRAFPGILASAGALEDIGLCAGGGARASAPTATGLMARPDARMRAAVGDYLPLVWRILRRAGLGAADADDAAQDVFWVLARRVDDVPERAQRSFLVSTALRVAADHRLSKWQRAVSSGLDADLRPSEAPLPDEALDQQRAVAFLDDALAALDPADRAVFVLTDLEQMTRSEVAESLGIPEGTVASRLRRAREAVEAAILRMRSRARFMR